MANAHGTFQIDLDKLYVLVTPPVSDGGRGGRDVGQPDPENPLKPGPWDPVIRHALKDLSRFSPGLEAWRGGPDPIPWFFGPRPHPWLESAISSGLLGLIASRFPAVWDVIGGGLRVGDYVSLNPQPLPPRERFIRALGKALVVRAEQLAEVAGTFRSRGADGGPDGGEERGIIIVSGYVNRLVDDWCGTGYRPRWPFPGPPPWWFRAEVGGRDILVLGAALHEAGRQAFDPNLGRALADAASKLAQVGLQRMA